jgi:hypothetical protein
MRESEIYEVNGDSYITRNLCLYYEDDKGAGIPQWYSTGLGAG